MSYRLVLVSRSYCYASTRLSYCRRPPAPTRIQLSRIPAPVSSR